MVKKKNNVKKKFAFYLYLIPCVLWLVLALDNFIRRQNMLGGIIFIILMFVELLFTIWYVRKSKKDA